LAKDTAIEVISRRVSRLLVMVLLIIGLMGWGVFETIRAFQAEQRARDQARLTTIVTTGISSAFSALIDAEGAQRGFIITRDATYLEPFLKSDDKFPEALGELRQQLEGVATKTQTDLLGSLDKLGTEKLAELRQTVELARNGQTEEAIAIINTNRGKGIMDKIRVVIGQLEAYEYGILTAAIERADKVQNRSAQLLLLLGLGVIVIFGIMLFQVWRMAKLSTVEANLAAVEVERAKTELLARELNHRVKNLFAIVLSMIRQTGRGETDVKVATGKIHDRVFALSRAHELTSKIDGAASTTLHELIEAVVSPFAPDPDALVLDGPAVSVSSNQVTPIGLIANELATNAVKYGAWSQPKAGRITVAWTKVETDQPSEGDTIALTWNETGVPTENPGLPNRKGFGSTLVELSIQQINGTHDVEWEDDGLKMELRFRLGE
jgi:two-component sensor histidine kinase